MIRELDPVNEQKEMVMRESQEFQLRLRYRIDPSSAHAMLRMLGAELEQTMQARAGPAVPAPVTVRI
jgi:hypothetical protein